MDGVVTLVQTQPFPSNLEERRDIFGNFALAVWNTDRAASVRQAGTRV
jgi:hypothetical protein